MVTGCSMMRPAFPSEITICCKVVKAWIAPQVVFAVILISLGVTIKVYDSSTPCCKSALGFAMLRDTDEIDLFLISDGDVDVGKTS